MAAIVQIIGLILIAVGVWMIFPPAAIVVSGIFMVALGVALERLKNAKSSATT
jgi:uncharacterized membrane protein